MSGFDLTGLNLAFAFTAGLVATVNPCGWAMLPSFVSYYLGSHESDYAARPLPSRALEGVALGLLVTAGFLAVFGAAAAVITAGLRVIVRFMPLAGLAVGAALVLLGLWLLLGRSLSIPIPQPRLDLRARNPWTVFLFGAAYGLVSLSCTLPIFLAVVGAGLAATSGSANAIMLLAYGAGIAAVLMSVAVGAAMLKEASLQFFRRWLPYVDRVSAILLIAAGLYLIWFQGRYLPLILSAL